MTTEADHGKAQAIAQFESIKAMLARLNHTQECHADEPEECTRPTTCPIEWSFEEYHDEEQAQEAICDDRLSVLVRSDWHAPSSNAEDGRNAEFEILLCTGGPACRIRGDLDCNGQPDRAYLQYQDWGTPWTDYHTEDMETLLDYARQFYFGDESKRLRASAWGYLPRTPGTVHVFCFAKGAGDRSAPFRSRMCQTGKAPGSPPDQPVPPNTRSTGVKENDSALQHTKVSPSIRGLA